MNNSICTLFDNILIDIHKFKSLQKMESPETSNFIKKLMVFNLQLIGSIEAILVSNLTMRGNEICDMLNERIKNESRLF